jgi:transcription initiation factor TFIIB
MSLKQEQRLLVHSEVRASKTRISHRISLNFSLFPSTLAAKYQNRRNMSSSDRALIAAFKEICTMADRINLPKTIVDRANNMFKQVHDGKNMKGCSNDAKALACLYIACRQEGIQCKFKEICAVSKTSKKEIGLCF